MFSITYKNTLKSLFRTFSFWLLLFVVLMVSVHGALSGFYGYDDDPEFVLTYQSYIQCIINSCAANMLMYALPLLIVFTTVFILNRDYGDKFFEIEKAANARPLAYLSGRLAALTTVAFVTLFVMNMLCLHLYVFTRGGVEGMPIGEYLLDSFIRVVRVDLIVGMPSLIFYIGITYLLGTVFKNGLPAAIISVGHIIGFYVFNFIFSARLAKEYFDYFSPIPNKLRFYFHYYDTEWFEMMLNRTKTTLNDAVFCICFLVGITAICYLVSFFRIKKRDI